MARPAATVCGLHSAAALAALAECAEAYKAALSVPSPVRIERYNAAQSGLATVLHAAWTCPDCQHQASQPLPLFPAL